MSIIIIVAISIGSVIGIAIIVAVVAYVLKKKGKNMKDRRKSGLKNSSPTKI